MRRLGRWLAPGLALLAAAGVSAAPLDPGATVGDVFAFRSPDGGATPRVALILCVDPHQEPAGGPAWRPFDPEVLYEIKVDNNNDAVADIVFQFRFTTAQRLPNLYQTYFGAGTGINAPTNSPAPVPPGTLIVPPQVTAFGSPGLGQRQSYTVTRVQGGVATPITGVGTFFAVPPNVGPRTLDYAALFNAGIFTTNQPNTKVFAGTVDDPSWADAGAFFDTLNLRSAIAPGVLSPAQDAANANVTSDSFSGLATNAIAIEVPVSALTRTGAVEAATSTAATIGVWGTTSRPRLTTRRAPLPQVSSGSWSQISRRGNPLVRELLIGTGFADRFAMDQPSNDAQFASFFLDPALARVVNAATGGAVTIPPPPRLDLLPLVTYAPPIAAPGTPAGPVADLLRLNTGRHADEPGERRPPRAPGRRSVGLPRRAPPRRRRPRHLAPLRPRGAESGLLHLSQQRLRRRRQRERRGLPLDVPLSRRRAERARPPPPRSGRAGLHDGSGGPLRALTKARKLARQPQLSSTSPSSRSSQASASESIALAERHPRQSTRSRAQVPRAAASSVAPFALQRPGKAAARSATLPHFFAAACSSFASALATLSLGAKAGSSASWSSIPLSAGAAPCFPASAFFFSRAVSFQIASRAACAVFKTSDWQAAPALSAAFAITTPFRLEPKRSSTSARLAAAPASQALVAPA